VTIDDIHDEIVELQREIVGVAPAAPELSAIVARIRELQGELERARSVLGPLVPDAARPKSPVERSADDLAAALVSLMRAATAKQEYGAPSGHPSD
jgi:hypothetical protein